MATICDAEDPTGFGLGRGIYVASRTQRNFHGVCATILNGKDAYLTLTRPMNADIMVSDGGFAATIYPVISFYEIQDARVEHLRVDGNRENNPTNAAAIYLYRGDHCDSTLHGARLHGGWNQFSAVQRCAGGSMCGGALCRLWPASGEWFPATLGDPLPSDRQR